MKKNKSYKLVLYCFIVFSLFFLCISCTSSSAIREPIYAEYYSLAEEYYNQKKWDKALDYYNKSAQSDALFSNALYKMGLVYIEQKKYSDAESAFSILLEKDKNNASILSFLAFAKAKQNKYDQAISLYEEALKLYPMNQSLKKNLALVHWYAGNKEQALAIQEELLEDNPLDLSLKELLKEEVTADSEKDLDKTEQTDIESLENEERNLIENNL